MGMFRNYLLAVTVGIVLSVVLMLALSSLLYVQFRKRDWL
jgi:hypothetical protein